ncbi:hypothetical protein SH1V18_26090 [Vallitalea longa]|uniref:MurNAc-LAA domain-containing protein n=1 Tax=Vallitalea longa TaxID=2936439 RepID=A0A9W5YDW0_9FIRM|nr:N-acetylmuramoyl-L-alanine amidase [Vallitalea longa]GKX30129.1 hypothetical protein SH1V18_26090 [Vallitalea longa]
MVKKIDNNVKINNVKLIINGNKTVEEIADKLEVSTKAVRHWEKVYIANRKKKRNRVIAGIILLLVICIPILLFTILHKKAKKVDETVVPEVTNQENESENINKDKNPIYSGVGTVFIDPGHGFSDCGTASPKEFGLDVTESKVVLDVSNRVVEILKANDYNVVTSRTENYNEIQEDKIYKVKLEERVKKANESNADVFVSLHINAFEESSSTNGYDIYYCDKGEEYNTTADKLAKMISTKFTEKTGIEKIKIREQKTRAYYVIRKTTMTSVLFEMGYATNLEDAKRLTDADFLENLAQSVAEGIMEFLTELHPKE